MANKIEFLNTEAKRFVTSTSRYLGSKVIRLTDRNVLTFETYKRRTAQNSGGDKFTVISPQYEYRPDLMAYDIYGVSNLWWKIMEANNIIDIFDFKTGVNLRLPNVIN